MKNKKNVIMIVMLVAVALMSMGYALFATQLNINSIGNITSQWNVYFESISNGTKVGNASNASTPSVSGTSANMNVNLDLPGDSMTYSLVLKNGGTVGAIIEDIDAKSEGSTGIIYTISGLKIGDKLAAGATKTITIKIEYDPNTSSQPVETYKKLTVTIDAVQDIGQSITTQTPTIEGEIGTLTRAILNDNQVQSDEYVELGKGSTYPIYEEIHAENLISVSLFSDSNIDYGSGYIFNELKGTYTLTGIIKEKWSAMATNYKNYPYTCKYGYSDHTCSKLYKITEYKSSSSGVGYEYSSKVKKHIENGQGLYYTNQNTEENKTTYYFRGNVENNYVKFGTRTISACRYNGQDLFYNDTVLVNEESVCLQSNVCYVEKGHNGHNYFIVPYGEDECMGRYGGVMLDKQATFFENLTEDMIWRIVRINENNSIRLMYDKLEMSGYFNSWPYNADIGYMYGTKNTTSYEEEHKNINDSLIKQKLDAWYTANLINYSSYLDGDAGFCNDRSVASTPNTWNSNDTALGYGANNTYYGTYNRLNNLRQPQFKCPKTQDLFTLSTSSKGNKKLTNPIGTITADEVVYAGASTYGTSNPSYYLTQRYFWTMSPESVSNYMASMKVVSYSGILTAVPTEVDTTVGMYPVINLKPTVKITGGNGTKDNPYVVNTN